MNPIRKRDNTFAEEIPSENCDNYLLCIYESKAALTDKRLDSIIGIVVSDLEKFVFQTCAV